MKTSILTVCILLSLVVQGRAQAFIYRPNNPNFGGNTFNYSWMLSSAQAQDRNKDPSTLNASRAFSTNTNSTLTNFAQSIQSQLLNRITSSLIGNQFGEGTLKPGTYTFGDFQVQITNGTDGVILRIVDGKGGETTVTVPYF